MARGAGEITAARCRVCVREVVVLAGFVEVVLAVDVEFTFLATVEGELPPDGFVVRCVGVEVAGAVVRGFASLPGEAAGRSAGAGASLPELPPDFL